MAQKNRAYLEDRMSAAQIAAAVERARTWRTAHPCCGLLAHPPALAPVANPCVTPKAVSRAGARGAGFGHGKGPA